MDSMFLCDPSFVDFLVFFFLCFFVVVFVVLCLRGSKNMKFGGQRYVCTSKTSGAIQNIISWPLAVPRLKIPWLIVHLIINYEHD